MKTARAWHFEIRAMNAQGGILASDCRCSIKDIEAIQSDALREGQRQGLLRAAQICRGLETADYKLSDEPKPMQRWLFLYFADAIEAEAQKLAVEITK